MKQFWLDFVVFMVDYSTYTIISYLCYVFFACHLSCWILFHLRCDYCFFQLTFTISRIPIYNPSQPVCPLVLYFQPPVTKLSISYILLSHFSSGSVFPLIALLVPLFNTVIYSFTISFICCILLDSYWVSVCCFWGYDDKWAGYSIFSSFILKWGDRFKNKLTK